MDYTGGRIARVQPGAGVIAACRDHSVESWHCCGAEDRGEGVLELDGAPCQRVRAGTTMDWLKGQPLQPGRFQSCWGETEVAASPSPACPLSTDQCLLASRLGKTTNKGQTDSEQGRERAGVPGGSAGKNLPAVLETRAQSLGGEDPLEKETATHSSVLPGKSHGPRSLTGSSPGVHRLGRDLATEQQQQEKAQGADPGKEPGSALQGVSRAAHCPPAQGHHQLLKGLRQWLYSDYTNVIWSITAFLYII